MVKQLIVSKVEFEGNGKGKGKGKGKNKVKQKGKTKNSEIPKRREDYGSPGHSNSVEPWSSLVAYPLESTKENSPRKGKQ